MKVVDRQSATVATGILFFHTREVKQVSNSNEVMLKERAEDETMGTVIETDGDINDIAVDDAVAKPEDMLFAVCPRADGGAELTLFSVDGGGVSRELTPMQVAALVRLLKPTETR